MLISYNELLDLVKEGVIAPVDIADVNGTSIDVHLGNFIMVERGRNAGNIVSLKDKDALEMQKIDITDGYYDLLPGEFILAQTSEVFNLPDNISAEFKLNSSGARIGLENALATWCDPHWNGSVLTLELKNLTRYHTVRLHAGCRIGQMIFHKSEPVPADRGYAVRGRYNGDTTVEGVKAVTIDPPAVCAHDFASDGDPGPGENMTLQCMNCGEVAEATPVEATLEQPAKATPTRAKAAKK